MEFIAYVFYSFASLQHAWDAVHKNKSDTKVQFPRLPGNKSNGAVQSPRLPGNKSDIGVQSSQLPEIEKMLTCRSNQFTTSGEQLIVNTSPPKKLPGSSRISPYRRERPQSPFRGGGFLGMPKEAAKFKANMSVRCTRSNNSSQELVPYQSTKQGSGPLSPAAEKTLYVDTVNFVEVASSDSNSSDTKVQTDHIGKHSDNRMLGNPACVESSLHGRKGLNLMDGKGISEYEITGSVNSSQSSFYDKMEDWMKSQGQQAEMDCFRENGGLNQESKSLQRIKVRAEGNLTFSDDDDDDSKAADQGIDKAGSDYSPLPPPLPKTPSESWLWRALPSATSRNSFPQSYVGTRFNPKNQEPKIPATDTKWETIVKTSYLHHDHVRYSEVNLSIHYSVSLMGVSFFVNTNTFMSLTGTSDSLFSAVQNLKKIAEGIIEFLALTTFVFSSFGSTWSELVKDFAAAYHFCFLLISSRSFSFHFCFAMLGMQVDLLALVVQAFKFISFLPTSAHEKAIVTSKIRFKSL